MKTRIQKWGDSLVLRIPKSFVDKIGLQQEMIVDVSLNDGILIISPMSKLKFTLDQLLAKINEENLHQEIDTGNTVGNETW